MIRCEKDCLDFKKFRHSKEKDKRRTDLICALEEAQKNKHFNYSKQEFYRSKKTHVTSHWKSHWNVKTYVPDAPGWRSCMDKNVSIMNCSLLMPHEAPTELLLGRERLSESHDNNASTGSVVDAADEDTIRALCRCEKDCLHMKKFSHSDN